MTNVLALLVFAIVVKAQQGNLTLNFWLFLIPSLSLYLFLGAEFTKVYARRHGSFIEPEEYAVSRQESEAQKQQ